MECIGGGKSCLITKLIWYFLVVIYDSLWQFLCTLFFAVSSASVTTVLIVLVLVLIVAGLIIGFAVYYKKKHGRYNVDVGYILFTYSNPCRESPNMPNVGSR